MFATTLVAEPMSAPALRGTLNKRVGVRSSLLSGTGRGCGPANRNGRSRLRRRENPEAMQKKSATRDGAAGRTVTSAIVGGTTMRGLRPTAQERGCAISAGPFAMMK